jgi:hypothetical protein
MQKPTRSNQPQLSLLARYESTPRFDIVRSPEHRRELVRNLAELLVEAANRPAHADRGNQESPDE